LSFTSFLSIGAAVFSLCTILFRGIQLLAAGGVQWEKAVYFSGDWRDTFLALPNLFFAYGSIVTLLPSYKEVKNRKIGKMYIAVIAMMVCSTTMYLSCK
jgi:amino acid permease